MELPGLGALLLLQNSLCFLCMYQSYKSALPETVGKKRKASHSGTQARVNDACDATCHLRLLYVWCACAFMCAGAVEQTGKCVACPIHRQSSSVVASHIVSLSQAAGWVSLCIFLYNCKDKHGFCVRGEMDDALSVGSWDSQNGILAP